MILVSLPKCQLFATDATVFKDNPTPYLNYLAVFASLSRIICLFFRHFSHSQSLGILKIVKTNPYFRRKFTTLLPNFSFLRLNKV